jgi:hypothetical protein
MEFKFQEFKVNDDLEPLLLLLTMILYLESVIALKLLNQESFSTQLYFNSSLSPAKSVVNVSANI